MINNHSRMVGFSFGVTSGTITTLGIMVGLYSSTQSFLAVIGGIIAVAIADAFSDAMGIHVAEEAELKHTKKEVWEATTATFFTKLVYTLTFALPFLVFPMPTAVLVCIAYGLVVLTAFSYYLGTKSEHSVIGTIGEHVLIAIAVIIITYYVGTLVANL
ncbi:MAG: hypothetical protein ABH829_01400 [archaeon]